MNEEEVQSFKSFIEDLKKEIVSLRSELKENKKETQEHIEELKSEISNYRENQNPKEEFLDQKKIFNEFQKGIANLIQETNQSLFTFKKEVNQELLDFKKGLLEDPNTFMNRRVRGLSITKEPEKVKTEILNYSNYERVLLNIGGKKFETLVETLTSEDNFFKNMLKLNLFNSKENGEYFIDRDPKLVPVILKYLRTSQLFISELSRDSVDELLQEVEFYQIQTMKKRINLIINYNGDKRLMQQLLNNDTRITELEIYADIFYQAINLCNPPIQTLKCYNYEPKSLIDLCEFLEKNKTVSKFSGIFENEPDISKLFISLSKNQSIKELDIKGKINFQAQF